MSRVANVILVVDDERDLVEAICANLEVEGYTVLTAHDGEDAVRVIDARDDVRLVLLDIRMPRVDGIQALARIRIKRPHLPVILMTAFAVHEAEERALELGAYTVVQKPFDMSVALQLIARAVRGPSLLLVDPDERLPELVAAMTRDKNHHVVAVASTHEAVNALRSGTIDVALLAVSSTKQIADMVRRFHEEKPSLSIVIVTNRSSQRTSVQTRNLRVAGWLHEPVTRASLLRTLAEVRARPAE